jgi:predicted DsbA family dithiol-disulfide isomerase
VANSGLDVATAAEVLDSKRYSQEVRAAQQQYLRQGISAVPAVIVNEKYVINGGQPSEIFEQALRDIADQIGPVQAPHTGDV